MWDKFANHFPGTNLLPNSWRSPRGDFLLSDQTDSSESSFLELFRLVLCYLKRRKFPLVGIWTLDFSHHKSFQNWNFWKSPYNIISVINSELIRIKVDKSSNLCLVLLVHHDFDNFCQKWFYHLPEWVRDLKSFMSSVDHLDDTMTFLLWTFFDLFPNSNLKAPLSKLTIRIFEQRRATFLTIRHFFEIWKKIKKYLKVQVFLLIIIPAL